MYFNKGDYENALENYKNCLKIMNKVLKSSSIHVAKILNTIGNVYYKKDDYEKAL
jgi:tetratricopeptide (TPR) repeat protein